MAIAYARTTTLSRADGGNAVRKAAYNAREKLVDQHGRTWNYSRRGGLVAAFIEAPAWAKPALSRRQELWIAAELAEKRKDSQLAREMIIALPCELTCAQQVEVMREFARQLVDRYGMVVDVAIHQPDGDTDERNYHAHVLMTTRRVDPKTGELGEKLEELRNRRTSGQHLKWMRQVYQDIINRYLAPEHQIDMRSYRDRGISRPSQVHLGKNRVWRERKTGQKDELRVAYERALAAWELQTLLAQAYALGVLGLIQEADTIYWDTSIIPATDAETLERHLRWELVQVLGTDAALVRADVQVDRDGLWFWDTDGQQWQAYPWEAIAEMELPMLRRLHQALETRLREGLAQYPDRFWFDADGNLVCGDQSLGWPPDPQRLAQVLQAPLQD